MEFKHEELVERELEIGSYLLNAVSLKDISKKTGLSKKHLDAHIKNMMKKLKADNMEDLINLLKTWKH